MCFSRMIQSSDNTFVIELYHFIVANTHFHLANVSSKTYFVTMKWYNDTI